MVYSRWDKIQIIGYSLANAVSGGTIALGIAALTGVASPALVTTAIIGSATFGLAYSANSTINFLDNRRKRLERSTNQKKDLEKLAEKRKALIIKIEKHLKKLPQKETQPDEKKSAEVIQALPPTEPTKTKKEKKATDSKADDALRVKKARDEAAAINRKQAREFRKRTKWLKKLEKREKLEAVLAVLNQPEKSNDETTIKVENLTSQTEEKKSIEPMNTSITPIPTGSPKSSTAMIISVGLQSLVKMGQASMSTYGVISSGATMADEDTPSIFSPLVLTAMTIVGTGAAYISGRFAKQEYDAERKEDEDYHHYLQMKQREEDELEHLNNLVDEALSPQPKTPIGTTQSSSADDEKSTAEIVLNHLPNVVPTIPTSLTQTSTLFAGNKTKEGEESSVLPPSFQRRGGKNLPPLHHSH